MRITEVVDYERYPEHDTYTREQAIEEFGGEELTSLRWSDASERHPAHWINDITGETVRAAEPERPSDVPLYEPKYYPKKTTESQTPDDFNADAVSKEEAIEIFSVPLVGNEANHRCDLVWVQDGPDGLPHYMNDYTGELELAKETERPADVPIGTV